MLYTTIVRLAMLVLMAVLLAPAGSVRATEHGAMLAVEGSTSTTVDGISVAASLQGEHAILNGTGFEPREPIGLWVTFADAAVRTIDTGALTADSRGGFSVDLELDGSLPLGLQRYSARGRSSGRGAIATFSLLPGGRPVSSSAGLDLTPRTVRQLETVRFAGSQFAASEQVALWLTLPDGSVLSLGRVNATASGVFDTALVMPEWLPVGRYMVSARGLVSGATAIAELTLRYGNGLDIAGAELAADIGRAKQRTRVEVRAGGFLANESVSFWLTLPNGAVLGLGDANTDGLGNLDADFLMSEALPAGQYYLSLRGNTSGLASFARLVLEPGPRSPGEE